MPETDANIRTTADEPTRDVKPDKAVEMYLKEKQADGAAQSTIYSHRSRLGHFTEWFQSETDYTHLSDLDGFDLKLFKLERFGEEDDGFGDYSRLTVKTQLDTLRRFMHFNAEIGAVPFSLPHRIKSPSKGDAGQRDNEIEDTRARKIAKHLDRYRYASFDHVLFHLLWYLMLRVGTARSIDVDNVHLDERYIELHHHPGQDTPLKKKGKSERKVAISETTASIIEDYIDTNRNDVEDEYGRNPLFTSEDGRASLNMMRNRVYALSRPCTVGECPHDRDPEECDAAQARNVAYKCPTSEATHAVRRGSITWHLREDTDKEIISERADVSVRVLDENYNNLSEREKMELRRDELPEGL